MEKFSVGILSWHSTDVLINTLTSYHNNGLLSLSDDVIIYFQEINSDDRSIAAHYGVKFLGTDKNVGIGKGMLELAKNASHNYILLLEHDWELIESPEVTKQSISNGTKLIQSGYDCVRYRSTRDAGYPNFSRMKYEGKELEYFDPEIQLPYPHLIDSVTWIDEPDKKFPGKIGVQWINNEKYYVANSKYANWTNNPCLYNKDFYIKTVKPFAGGGIDLEGKISYWWARQNYNVAYGQGLFKHNDPSKYGNDINIKNK